MLGGRGRGCISEIGSANIHPRPSSSSWAGTGIQANDGRLSGAVASRGSSESCGRSRQDPKYSTHLVTKVDRSGKVRYLDGVHLRSVGLVGGLAAARTAGESWGAGELGSLGDGHLGSWGPEWVRSTSASSFHYSPLVTCGHWTSPQIHVWVEIGTKYIDTLPRAGTVQYPSMCLPYARLPTMKAVRSQHLR